jgi:acetoin utilization protein AcuB
MLVGLWMTRNPVTVTAATCVTDAALTMSQHRVRRLPVVIDLHGAPHLVGILTNLDVARAYPPDVNPFSADPLTSRIDTTVGEVMTSDPLTIAPSAALEEAARLLRGRRIGALPVVSQDVLVGIITESDIFRALMELVGGGGVRITFDVSDDEDVLTLAMVLGRVHDLNVQGVLSLAHGGRRMATVRLTGAGAGRFVDELWKSGHRVLSVLGLDPAEDAPA